MNPSEDHWTIMTTATLDQYEQALREIEEQLEPAVQRKLKDRERAGAPQDITSANLALASLMNLQNEIIDYRQHPNRHLVGRLLPNIPEIPALTRPMETALTIGHALFDPLSNVNLTRHWIGHAHIPQEGETTTLADTKQAYKDTMVQLKAQAGPNNQIDFFNNLDTNQLPPRENVARNGRPLKGWKDTRLDPEAGYRALLAIAEVRLAAAAALRERHYAAQPPTA